MITTKSLPFCPSCSKCPQCCLRTECRGKTTKFLASLAGLGFESSGSLILKEGYTLPFKQRPRLTRFPLIQSGYANPKRNMFLKEALINLMTKLVVEKVVVRSSLAFYNRPFLVPKPNGKWKPTLDLSQLNLFLSTGTFKMETPKTIRFHYRQGSGSLRWISATPTSISPLPKDQESISGSSCSIRLFNSQLSHSGWPQLRWISPRWSKR